MNRILIVDDEPAIRSVLSLVFVRAGYDVRTAADAFKAIELCSSEPFDAILSDVQMPGMDGHSLVRWVAATYPNVRPALMSANEIHCGNCPLEGRCKLLRKPFNPNYAVALITKVIGEVADSCRHLQSGKYSVSRRIRHPESS
jgi:CheY-like chemotaxis protein